MRIIIKKLQGGECIVDVQPSTMISEIKQEIAVKLGIPVDDQKLLLLGRTLADNQPIQSYPSIRDGSKLNLIVKKPESFFDVSVRYFKSTGLQPKEAVEAAHRLNRIVEEKIKRMSWDDVNRLALDCLISEGSVDPLEFDCDNMYIM